MLNPLLRLLLWLLCSSMALQRLQSVFGVLLRQSELDQELFRLAVRLGVPDAWHRRDARQPCVQGHALQVWMVQSLRQLPSLRAVREEGRHRRAPVFDGRAGVCPPQLLPRSQLLQQRGGRQAAQEELQRREAVGSLQFSALTRPWREPRAAQGLLLSHLPRLPASGRWVGANRASAVAKSDGTVHRLLPLLRSRAHASAPVVVQVERGRD